MKIWTFISPRHSLLIWFMCVYFIDINVLCYSIEWNIFLIRELILYGQIAWIIEFSGFYYVHAKPKYMSWAINKQNYCCGDAEASSQCVFVRVWFSAITHTILIAELVWATFDDLHYYQMKHIIGKYWSTHHRRRRLIGLSAERWAISQMSCNLFHYPFVGSSLQKFCSIYRIGRTHKIKLIY